MTARPKVRDNVGKEWFDPYYDEPDDSMFTEESNN